MGKTAIFTKLDDVICFFVTDGKILYNADAEKVKDEKTNCEKAKGEKTKGEKTKGERPDNRAILDAKKASIGDIEVGNVYLGKIRNVSKNLSACFVEYKEGVTGFLSVNKNEIDEYKGGMLLPVTVVKDKVKTKDAVLSKDITLAGMYVVVSDNGCGIKYSGKLEDDKKDPFKELLNEKIKENNVTCVVRNLAGFLDLSDADDRTRIICEFDELCHKLKDIRDYSDKRTAFSRLYEGAGFVRKNLAVLDLSDTEKIITDDPDTYTLITSLLPSGISDKCVYYSDDYPLKALYNLKKQVSETISKRIWLKSGGFLVIDETEAMTVIDVNTGKNEGKISKNELIEITNKEAVSRIAPLITASGMSGIIIVDLVGVDAEAIRKSGVLEMFSQLFKNDHDNARAVDITKLGLVEITRMKRERPLIRKLKECGIYEAFKDE